MISSNQLVRSFKSSDPAYSAAFRTFLDHTDQKRNARLWLEQAVNQREQRDVLVDAGAGNGELTDWLSNWFGVTIGIEPNAGLFAELKPRCDKAEMATILEAVPEAIGDFVLCSHVFYYIPKTQWAANLQRLLDWMTPSGELIVVLQNRHSDGMTMINHFCGNSFDLRDLVPLLDEMRGGPYQAVVDCVPASVRTESLHDACTIAEFMLNVLPIPEGLSWTKLSRYVEDEFADLDGGYSFSCDQDFLRITRQP